MKVDSKRAIFEFLSIIVAVVVAMTLSELRQDYNNKKLAERSYEEILNEVEENLEELRKDSVRISKDLEFIVNWMIKYSEDKNPGDFDVNYNFSFLNSSALEVAKINQALSFLPQEKLMRIYEIYATQEFYGQKGPEVFNVMSELTSLSFERQPEVFFSQVKRFRFHLGLILGTMRAYMQEAEELLREEKLT